MINALSYAAPLVALLRMGTSELHTRPPAEPQAGQLGDGLRSAALYPDVLWPTILAGVFGMFAANLPVTLAAYAHSVFHSGPGGYGLLSAIVAVGSVTGALVSARRPRARLSTLIVFGFMLAAADMLAAAAPGQVVFCLLLLPVGACTLLLLTATNSTVQLGAPDAIRGRVMGLYLLVFIGGAAIGGPLLGLVDQHLGPRAGMLLAGAVPAAVTAAIALRLARARRSSPQAARLSSLERRHSRQAQNLSRRKLEGIRGHGNIHRGAMSVKSKSEIALSTRPAPTARSSTARAPPSSSPPGSLIRTLTWRSFLLASPAGRQSPRARFQAR